MSGRGTSVRRSRVAWHIALGIGCSLLLAACGGSTAGPGATGSPPQAVSSASALSGSGTASQACSLLSTAEVEAAVGNPVADGVADLANACTWEKGDPTKITVALHLLGLSGGEKCAAGRQGSSPITSLGVEASWDFVPAAETGSVVACPAGWQVQVTLVGDIVNLTTSEASLRAAGEKLMGLVLKRM